MAAAVHELDGLYFHFKHLLFSGFKADLQIKSENGNALASLTAEIKLVNDYKVVRKKKKRGPSYFNRLEKRKQARNNSRQGNTAEKAILQMTMMPLTKLMIETLKRLCPPLM